MKNLFLILIFVFWISASACGGSGGDSEEVSFSETKDGGGLQLTVLNSQIPSLSKSVQIAHYKITLEGDDMAPLEKIVSSDASGVQIKGIPQGKNRRVHVAALNAQNQMLREGLVENVEIKGGKGAQATVSLESVPVVLNLSDQDHVSNQRLYFQIFSDPKHDLTVEEEQPLPDIATSQSRIPSDDEGFVKHYPGVLSPGLHHFTVRDLTTGKTTSIAIDLWNGANIKAAPLFAASAKSTRFGQTTARSGQGNLRGEEFFPNIAEVLWKAK